MLLPRFSPLQSGAAFSSPAFSTPAVWCRVFHSRVFHPCIFATPAFSSPAFSAPPRTTTLNRHNASCARVKLHRFSGVDVYTTLVFAYRHKVAVWLSAIRRSLLYDSTGTGDRLRTTLVCNQPFTSTQPGHSSMGRHSQNSSNTLTL